jgi:hypothetical protein
MTAIQFSTLITNLWLIGAFLYRGPIWGVLFMLLMAIAWLLAGIMRDKP